MFADGAVYAEKLTATRLRWIGSAYLNAVLAVAGLMAPLVMPILSVEDFLAYQHGFGGLTPIVFENKPNDRPPQYFSDEFGWEAMTVQTAKVYGRLSEFEKADTAIFANDYGQAAAIDFFGPKYGLPAWISNAESFWLWGPRAYTGTRVIVLGSDGKGDRERFGSVEVAGRVADPNAQSDEQPDIFLLPRPRHESAAGVAVDEKVEIRPRGCENSTPARSAPWPPVRLTRNRPAHRGALRGTGEIGAPPPCICRRRVAKDQSLYSR